MSLTGLGLEYARWKNWRKKVYGVLKRMPKPVPVPAPKPSPAPAPPPRPKPSPSTFQPREGVDGVSVPGGAELRASGKHFVGRYLSTPGNAKNLRKAEVADLHAHGLGIALIFETTGKSFEGGRAAGVADAKLALDGLRALGAPSSVAVYFAVDANPHGHEASIVSYIEGASSVLGHGRTGVYGGLGAVDSCFKAAACRFFFQTYGWSGSPTVWHRARHLGQYRNGVSLAGHQVDLDRQVKAAAGLWLP